MAYENPEAQASARALIPIKKLQENATDKFEKLKKEAMQKSTEISEDLKHDILVIEVLRWFKKDFFKWFDGYECDKCTSTGADGSIKKLKCQPCGYDQASPAESEDGAGTVEKYRCDTCQKIFRFPRYHSRPEKLLTWKKGRCGEFANCFALILRSLGYDTRRVLDWTDHVWCEV